jgi:hypothetical protein
MKGYNIDDPGNQLTQEAVSGQDVPGHSAWESLIEFEALFECEQL